MNRPILQDEEDGVDGVDGELHEGVVLATNGGQGLTPRLQGSSVGVVPEGVVGHVEAGAEVAGRELGAAALAPRRLRSHEAPRTVATMNFTNP